MTIFIWYVLLGILNIEIGRSKLSALIVEDWLLPWALLFNKAMLADLSISTIALSKKKTLKFWFE